MENTAGFSFIWSTGRRYSISRSAEVLEFEGEKFGQAAEAEQQDDQFEVEEIHVDDADVLNEPEPMSIDQLT